jgi:hypothetical protein
MGQIDTTIQGPGKPLTRLEQAISRGKGELLQDVRQGKIPASVRSFAQLHDYLDANYYGGAFEQNDLTIQEWNQVQAALDQWIAGGGLRQAYQRSLLNKKAGRG